MVVDDSCNNRNQWRFARWSLRHLHGPASLRHKFWTRFGVAPLPGRLHKVNTHRILRLARPSCHLDEASSLRAVRSSGAAHAWQTRIVEVRLLPGSLFALICHGFTQRAFTAFQRRSCVYHSGAASSRLWKAQVENKFVDFVAPQAAEKTWKDT